MELILFLLLVVLVVLVFDYTNGFHDAANAIATVVATRVLTPRQAVILAAVMNSSERCQVWPLQKTMGRVWWILTTLQRRRSCARCSPALHGTF